jgi:hypothetical protein
VGSEGEEVSTSLRTISRAPNRRARRRWSRRAHSRSFRTGHRSFVRPATISVPMRLIGSSAAAIVRRRGACAAVRTPSRTPAWIEGSLTSPPIGSRRWSASQSDHSAERLGAPRSADRSVLSPSHALPRVGGRGDSQRANHHSLFLVSVGELELVDGDEGRGVVGSGASSTLSTEVLGGR